MRIDALCVLRECWFESAVYVVGVVWFDGRCVVCVRDPLALGTTYYCNFGCLLVHAGLHMSRGYWCMVATLLGGVCFVLPGSLLVDCNCSGDVLVRRKAGQVAGCIGGSRILLYFGGWSQVDRVLWRTHGRTWWPTASADAVCKCT